MENMLLESNIEAEVIVQESKEETQEEAIDEASNDYEYEEDEVNSLLIKQMEEQFSVIS